MGHTCGQGLHRGLGFRTAPFRATNEEAQRNCEETASEPIWRGGDCSEYMRRRTGACVERRARCVFARPYFAVYPPCQLLSGNGVCCYYQNDYIVVTSVDPANIGCSFYFTENNQNSELYLEFENIIDHNIGDEKH